MDESHHPTVSGLYSMYRVTKALTQHAFLSTLVARHQIQTRAGTGDIGQVRLLYQLVCESILAGLSLYVLKFLFVSDTVVEASVTILLLAFLLYNAMISF